MRQANKMNIDWSKICNTHVSLRLQRRAVPFDAVFFEDSN